ncbi:MAG: DUF3387 domain-containing protein [Victivallales bacterium]|nr:DUF3387 domain-containing protein [Victivallales bacterium]
MISPKRSADTFEQLVASIQSVHTVLSDHASKAVNISLTVRNWLIGCYIAEYELHGADRAEYGENLLGNLASRLEGLSNCNRRKLYDYLKFYRTYPQIVRTVSAQFQPLMPECISADDMKVPTASAQSNFPPERLLSSLSYSKLKLLVELDDDTKRAFYEFECIRGNWSVRELLSSDFRGLIVSMIHKFDGIKKDINTRENIFVLVDEAHRTTGGDLGNYLLGALPKATLIGFTGTPIDKTAYGKGTFKTFGKEDEEGYLDKYSIAESIADGTTVPLKYTLAPSEIRVPREQLEEEFLNIAEAEGVSDVDELNRILDHAMRLKTFLKSKGRVEKVAAFVAEHFTNNVEPLGYKAFLVAVDRETCALYKEALDKILPPEYSLPIYTSAQHDSERYPQVYRHQVAPDAEKKARKLFPKADTQPKIFIVTDKLLTGFDAPVLYCMYLDKPMRDHVLLQAVARVNRPYERDADTQKPCGLVVDFVGVFEKLEKALAFDSDVVSGVIEDMDILFDKFKEIMTGPARNYIDLCQGGIDDKSVEKAIETFSEMEKREAFYKLYKQLEMLYEILSPSPKLRDFIDEFGCLSLLYQIICNAFRKKTILYGDIARKTEQLVREKAESFGLETTISVVKIDEKTLEAIKENSSSDKAKIINLVNSVRKTVLEDGESNPYLKPIGDRAEAIMDAYDERQVATEVALKKIEALIREIVEAQRQQQKMGFDENTFSFFWTLKNEDVAQPDRTAVVIGEIFERFIHHRDNAAELRQLKAELYKALLPLVGKERMIHVAEKLLRAEASP